MKTNKACIDVVIPSWNGKKMLAACLDSLKLQSNRCFQVIVVDNGSTDGTREFIENNFPEIHFIGLNYNTGFSVAVNAGIQSAQADWILLLNNDMEVAPYCVENITKAFSTYPDYDFFALKMINYHNRSLLDGAGDVVLRGGVGYRIGTLEPDSEKYQYDRETFGACAGAAVYSRAFFDRAGLFDPDFFAYLEDVDLNMRARKIGLRCMYLADAKVYHIGSATSGSKINPLTIRLSTRNNFAVIIKNYPLRMLLRFLPAILIYQSLWLVFCIKKKMFFPYFHGILEGVTMLGGNLRKRFDLKTENPRWFDHSYSFADEVKRAECEAVTSIMSRRQSQGKNNLALKLYRKLFL